MNWRIDSMLRQTTHAEEEAEQRPDRADRGAGDEEDAEDGAARRAHGAQNRDVMALVADEHGEPADDVERGDDDDEQEDEEHDVPLDLERREEGDVPLLPVAGHDLPLGCRLDLRAERGDRCRHWRERPRWRSPRRRD